MQYILKAMQSEYGDRWDKMSDKEQIGAIASFLHNYLLITKEIILL